MAKFNISYDSESKKLSADLDGTVLNNIQEIRIYKYGEHDGSICIGMGEVKDKVMYFTRVEAAKSEEGKKAILDGSGLLIQDMVLIVKE